MTLLRGSLCAFALCVGSANASAADCADAVRVETKMIRILDHESRKPLGELAVEVTSEVVAPCFKAPCPVQSQQRWQGTTDERGVLAFPVSLEPPGAIVYVHAVGSSFAADVHGDGAVDENGLPIVQLQRAAEAKRP